MPATNDKSLNEIIEDRQELAEVYARVVEWQTQQT